MVEALGLLAQEVAIALSGKIPLSQD